jgi:hypothetical protein
MHSATPIAGAIGLKTKFLQQVSPRYYFVRHDLGSK